MRSVSDGRWKLIRYPLVDRTQLFDLENDPHELANLAGRPEHASVQKRLQALLVSEMKACADPSPLEVPNPAKAEWTPPSKEKLAADDAAAAARRKKQAPKNPKKKQ
jgi:arylsulfatase A-like enzyme